jgi:protein-disulfide isomerase
MPGSRPNQAMHQLARSADFTRVSVVLSALWIAQAALAQSQACIPLSSAARDRITAYVAKLAKVPAEASLQLISSDPQEDTCYRRLEFQRSDALARFSLLLSPDQRFLMPQLFDSNRDPAVAEAKGIERLKAQINDYIEKHASPMLGPSTAPATIAVFSDLQCPFCRRAMNLLQTQVLAESNNQIRVAYIGFPLSIHDWAKPAAIDLACVAQQSRQSFWIIHDYLFDHQSEIRAETLSQAIEAEVAKQNSISAAHLNLDRLKHCMDFRESLSSVEQDLQFGMSIGIRSTPTLFINGRAQVGAKDANEILQIIARSSGQPWASTSQQGQK